MSTLGEVTEKIETVDPRREPDTEFRYVDVSSVSSESLLITEANTLLGKDAPSRARRCIRKNDVIFATVRPTLKRIAFVPADLDGQVCSTGFYVLRAEKEIHPRFIFYYLQTADFIDRMEELQSGASYPAVNDRQMRESPIPLPPLSEQRRIVSVLDAAFAGLATAEAHTRQNLTNARELFEAFLAQRVREPQGDWTESSLKELAENLDRHRVPITKSQRITGEVPYYGASGVVDHVADFIFDEELLLVSEDGANLLARTYPIAFSISGKSWVNNHAHVLRFSDRALQSWVEHILNIKPIGDFVNGAAQPKLNQKALNAIPIPVPPQSKLPALVNQIEALQESVRQLLVIANRKLAALAALKQSLLHRAFRGELSGEGVTV